MFTFAISSADEFLVKSIISWCCFCCCCRRRRRRRCCCC